MKNVFFPLLLLALFLTACPGSDDDLVVEGPEFNALQIDIVTGINAFRIDGSPNGSYGNPNTFAGDLVVYPVPAIDFVQVQHLGSPTLDVINLWIVPANADTSLSSVDFSELLDNETYSADAVAEATPPDHSAMPNADVFAFDLSAFPAGYYRIFLQTSDERIFWENIYLDPDGGTPEAILQDIVADWQ